VTKSKTLLGLVIVVGAATLIYFLGITLNEQRYSGDIIEELMYFPSGRMLRVASLGYDTLVADLLWLRGIQYYGEHRRGDQEYPLAEHVFATITDLDPRFIGAYRFGAYVLAQDVGQPAAGIELLKKGIRNNPDRWQLPFDLGFMYFIELEDNAKAAHFFRFASRFADAPEITKRFTAFAYRKAGRTNVAKALWEEIHRSSPNEIVREAAEYALKNIHLDDTVDALDAMVERFRSDNGRSPAGLNELVTSGLLKGIPHDPFGGEYFLDPRTQTVMSTTRVTDRAEDNKRFLEKLTARYAEKKGHYPASILDLIEEGLVPEVAEVAGARMLYDPETGTVRYIFGWEVTQ
jgi:tetratricopeptide (TPR) repeat protein